MESGLPQRWSPKHQGRILVAEDDPELRDLIAWALRVDGYAVEAMEDGDQVLRRLGTVEDDASEQAPDLLVSDIRMPGHSGLEVVEHLRRAHAPLPVLLVTAFADHEIRTRAARLGARLLDKPFTLDDLRRTVFDVLELT